MVKQLFAVLGSLLLALVAGTAVAMPGAFRITQLYSNADGSVQFVVVLDTGAADCDSTEAMWVGFRSQHGDRAAEDLRLPERPSPTCATTEQLGSHRHRGLRRARASDAGLRDAERVPAAPGRSVTLASHHLVNYDGAARRRGPRARGVAGRLRVRSCPTSATNLTGASASVVPGPPPPPSATVAAISTTTRRPTTTYHRDRGRDRRARPGDARRLVAHRSPVQRGRRRGHGGERGVPLLQHGVRRRRDRTSTRRMRTSARW